jgi:hypothetical protein
MFNKQYGKITAIITPQHENVQKYHLRLRHGDGPIKHPPPI